MERAKKILIIPSWYPSPASPINGVFVREQAKALARRFDVTVLTPRFPSLADQLRLRWGPDLLREKDEGIDTWRIRKLKIPTLRRWIPFFRTPDHVLVYYRKFAAAIREGFSRLVRQKGLPDLLHAHVVFPAGWIAGELGKRHGIPVVLTEHSGPFAMHLTTSTQRAMVREILSGSDQVVAVSSALRDTMRAFCSALEINVVGNVIDTDFFVPGPIVGGNQPPRRFFVLAGLLESKGIQFLVQAVHRLVTAGFASVEVCVGGDGPYRPVLEKQVADLRLGRHWRFLGELRREQVREQMQACDVFVLPSLGETFGVVLGEAMACGKPVLSTLCGGPQEVVTADTGILVPPGDVRSLADAMAGFLQQRFSFRPEVIRESVVRRFGATAFTDAMEKIYAAALGNRSALGRRAA